MLKRSLYTVASGVLALDRAIAVGLGAEVEPSFERFGVVFVVDIDQPYVNVWPEQALQYCQRFGVASLDAHARHFFPLGEARVWVAYLDVATACVVHVCLLLAFARPRGFARRASAGLVSGFRLRAVRSLVRTTAAACPGLPGYAFLVRKGRALCATRSLA